MKTPLLLTSRTKIVATLGPASNSLNRVKKLQEKGLDVVRLNFSHGDRQTHIDTFKMVRETDLAILADIQGPKIRTGLFDKEYYDLKEGAICYVHDRLEEIGNGERFAIQYPEIAEDLSADDFIYINDGMVKLLVLESDGKELKCRVLNGGRISNNKGCNIPKGQLRVELLSSKDKEDLKYLAELNPEFIAASFVGNANDVASIRNLLREYGNEDIKIISKIERPIAVENIDEILEMSDGVMIARGDLGVEIPSYRVPIVQKTIIRKANRLGKPVIVATQMLESMISQSRSTRAEASDVFNAVLDRCDAVMLSGETSVGKYPVESVDTMNQIIAAADDHIPALDLSTLDTGDLGTIESLCHSCYHLVHRDKSNRPGTFLVYTETGMTAKTLAKYRPGLSIVAITPCERISRELKLTWGVNSIHIPNAISDKLYSDEELLSIAMDKGFIQRGIKQDILLVENFKKQPNRPQKSSIRWIGMEGDEL